MYDLNCIYVAKNRVLNKVLQIKKNIAYTNIFYEYIY